MAWTDDWAPVEGLCTSLSAPVLTTWPEGVDSETSFKEVNSLKQIKKCNRPNERLIFFSFFGVQNDCKTHSGIAAYNSH